ncbi:hypothetical protein [Streptomyces sp. MK7]|uniref:hypothetical protein n=1 Tax=Streptomyces sp. MK7 TaxID=3067635 RepID=UPI00292D6975|nr:hypothetical protein [Streptomyces sp. MK7]
MTIRYRPVGVCVRGSGRDSTNAAAVATRRRARSPKRAGRAAVESPATALITPIAAYTSPAWSSSPSRRVNAVMPAWQAPDIAP